ncbi:MAG TPA: DeoR/GlpR family DNA-binding transcription regulator [Roseiflexaceae bacterium]|jgi:DeoR/GlpR family transcriptional regulator of sugar metabolism|nr:DeoR/GlpR family DNA-binding transcription regulator [Roseiflexaceae bacterium]
MLKPQERQQQIIKDIGTLDDNIIPRLSQKYGVSEMTIRRDLKVLEETGLIKRTYGGAVRWPEPPLLVRDKRQTLAQSQKARIARYAAEYLVQHGDIIILEGGTTATAMATYLADKDDLTVVTNGMATAEELRRHLPLSATIIATGGILRPESSTCVGPVTERFFREFHANRLFLSATGLTLQEGITDPKMLETQVKRAMIASAGEVIMLVDSTKFGVRSLMKVLDWGEIAMLVTDDNASDIMRAGLREKGVEVVVAPSM